MRKGDNPFEPGAGTKPPELVGRDLALEDAEAAIERASKGKPLRGQVFYGLRGVGKTVLLRAVSELAKKHSGIVSDLEASEDKKLTEIIVPSMRQILIQLSTKEKAKAVLSSAAGTLQSFAAKFKIKIDDVGIEVKERSRGLADSGDLESDLADLFVQIGEAAKEQARVIIVALDEMQYLKEIELAALITAIHRVNQKSLPIGLFGAGLPQLLGLAGNAKSYSERLFEFVEIGALTESDAKTAIRSPILSSNASIEDEALVYIYQVTKGYPYFLQEWGYRVWNEAPRSPIRKIDAIAAEKHALASLDKSFFRVRFDRLTQGEQQYLRAMAELGPGPHKSGDVARALGKSANQVGPVRAQVIAKGMAYGGQYGMIHFSVPMFDEFMKRAVPDFKNHQVRAGKAATPEEVRNKVKPTPKKGKREKE